MLLISKQLLHSICKKSPMLGRTFSARVFTPEDLACTIVLNQNAESSMNSMLYKKLRNKWSNLRFFFLLYASIPAMDTIQNNPNYKADCVFNIPAATTKKTPTSKSHTQRKRKLPESVNCRTIFLDKARFIACRN